MTIKPLTFCAPYKKVDCGQTVYLCLSTEWSQNTVSGFPFILATIRSVGSKSYVPPKPPSSCNPCVTPAPDPCPPQDPCASSCPSLVTYCVDYDAEQLLINPATGSFYELTDNDVISVFPDYCVLQELLKKINASNVDWVFDENNSDISFDTTDPSNPVINFDFIIRDRVSNTQVGAFNDSIAIDLCALIASCFTATDVCAGGYFTGV